MRLTYLGLLAFTVVFVATQAGSVDERKAGPAWPGAFPEIAGYEATFRPAIVKQRDGKSTIYSQTVRYDWLGGRLEAIEVTLARDAQFEMNYDPARLKGQDMPPDAIKIGKYPAYLWEKGELVVILGKDRILRVVSKTEKYFQSDLPEFTRRFDLAKCVRALDGPPQNPPK